MKTIKVKASIALIISVALSLMMAGVGNAECERCSDSRNACTGDSEREILDKCGPPTKTVYHYNIFREIVAVTHYYDLGSGRFIRAFTFRNGVLSEIGTFK